MDKWAAVESQISPSSKIPLWPPRVVVKFVGGGKGKKGSIPVPGGMRATRELWEGDVRDHALSGGR